jgi:hypothetical protein
MVNLNSPIVAGLVVAAFMGAINLVTLWINILHNRKYNATRATNKILNEKVNKSDCYPAMRRVGKQLDKADDSIERNGENIAGLRNAMIFLVTKADGNPADMGLMK